MNDIAEISCLWMWWRQCLKALKVCPHSSALQYAAAKAQADLVIYQAAYFASIRP